MQAAVAFRRAMALAKGVAVVAAGLLIDALMPVAAIRPAVCLA